VAAALPALAGTDAVAPDDPAAREPLPLPAPVFEEIAAPGLDFRYDNALSGAFLMPEISCGGAALFDADGDGDLDLFFVQGAPLVPPPAAAAADGDDDRPPPPSDRLYRNDLTRDASGAPRFAFTDVTAAAGVTDDVYGCGVAAGDYDDDGDVDLYVANVGPNRLLRNRGDGRFEDVTAAAGAGDDRWSSSAIFTDYDGDGWLDLFVVNYVLYDARHPKACRTASGQPDYCNPAAYPGVPNRLLHNRGDGTFEDVSRAAGPGSARGKSLGTVAADLDGDGRTDLYVTNDGEANELWLQTRPGRFEESALYAGCAVNGRGQPEASMGVVAEDDDGDGDLDLFLTHLTGETHTLYRNDGSGGFRDATTAAGLGVASLPFTGWGTVWSDVDNDGWLDLPVVDGAVRTLPALAAAGDPYPFHQPDQLYRNLGASGRPGVYADASAAAGASFAEPRVSRGLAAGDLDDDGDLDLVVVDLLQPARLLLDRIGQDRPWLGLRLVGGDGGGDQLGARVDLLAADGSVLATRRAASDGGFASARDPRVLFGLGSAPAATSYAVRVTWPGGTREGFRGLAPGRYTTLRRGSGTMEKTPQ